MVNEPVKQEAASNPLLTPSKLPYEVPDFAAIEFEDIEPALLAGLAEEKDDWHRIATNPEAADVDNTVEAVDRAGELLDRASAFFWTMVSSVGGEELDALQEKMAPLFSEHNDDFHTNEALYERFKEVAKLPDLDPETKWLVTDTIKDFEREGVNLNDKAKRKLRKLNAKIATLEAKIYTLITNQLVETGLTGTSLDELEGLSDREIAAATVAAGEGEGWRLGVMNYSLPPNLAALKDPETRVKLLATSLGRGSTGEEDTDTRQLILDLVKTRAKRARLLGFPSHSAIVIDEETVPSPQVATELLENVGKAAKVRLDEEAEQYGLESEKDGVELGPAHWPFYEEKAREASLGVDVEELRNYFELDRVVDDGMFYAANKLYGLKFAPRPDIVGWAPEVKTWEVTEEDGTPVGLFMADFYARPGKSGGAWMSGLVEGSRRSGRLPVITNNSNFAKPADGQPTLLTWDEVETLFHEFGHALHGLLTDTYYDATAGTSVPRDFVELPSQLNEMWAYHPEVLGRFAKHCETGEVLSPAVVEALAESKFFGQPAATLEYVQSALIDQAWHGSDPTPEQVEDLDAFEQQILKASGADHAMVVPRYRTPYFAHCFAGGYDAGYYSYMWAEAMVATLEEWLREGDDSENGGLNRDAGQKLRDELLSRGNSRDPMESFVAVSGRAPDATAVVRRRGL